MSAQPASAPNQGSVAPSSDLGAKLVTLAGIGLVGYGLMFLIRNFTGRKSYSGGPRQLRDESKRRTARRTSAGTTLSGVY